MNYLFKYKALKRSVVLEQFLIKHYIPYSVKQTALLIAAKDRPYFKFIWARKPVTMKAHQRELAWVKIKA